MDSVLNRTHQLFILVNVGSKTKIMRLEILLLQKRIVKNTKSSHEYNSSHSDNIKLYNKLYNCKKVIIKLSENSISL